VVKTMIADPAALAESATAVESILAREPG